VLVIVVVLVLLTARRSTTTTTTIGEEAGISRSSSCPRFFDRCRGEMKKDEHEHEHDDEGASAPLHYLGEDRFLEVDEKRPGPNAGPIEVYRGFEDQFAAFHHQDPVGQRHRFFDVVGD
jgi:hypothetical protein